VIIKGGKMSEAIHSIFKNEKISVGILLMIIPMLIAAKSWADTEYVLQDDFEKLTETIDTHVTEFQAAREEQRIEAASQNIRDIKMESRIATAVGTDPTEIVSITERLHDAEEYKQCLVLRQPNCKHLKHQ